MNKFTIKRITLFLLSMLLIVLSGCGNTSAVGSASTKTAGSKLKGDFVFYEKDGATYYTNCGDIGETKLVDDKVSSIYLDEKRKNIIFSTENNGLCIKPIKPNSERITIQSGVPKSLLVVENKYIVYLTTGVFGSGRLLYVYDLDSKNNVPLSQSIYAEGEIHYKRDYFVYHNYKITYLEKTSSYKEYNLCTYDLKTNKKETTEIHEAFGRNVLKLSNETLYYNIYDINDSYFNIHSSNNKKNDGMTESRLYKVVAGKEPELIDSVASEIKYRKAERTEDIFEQHLNLFPKAAFNDNGLYYFKQEKYTSVDKNGHWETEGNLYFYDGKSSVAVMSERAYDFSGFHISTVGSKEENISRSIFACKAGTFVGSKLYEEKSACLSVNNNIFITDKKEVINLESGAEYYLDPTPMSLDYIFFFDKDNTLYLTNANAVGLVLNGKTILNLANPYADPRCEYNENLSSIVLVEGKDSDTQILWHYKDGQANQVSSDSKDGHITNSGNASYIRDNNLYLYANGESNLVASDVNSSMGYSIIR